jgi:hypothetical protein
MTRKLLEAVVASNIPSEKFLFRNLPENETERAIYANRSHPPCGKNPKSYAWCDAGTSSRNLGYSLSIEHPLTTHTAILDDDDYWFPHHLENVVQAYENFPGARFTFSSGIHLGRRLPNPKKINSVKFNVSTTTPLFPEQTNCIMSLWTWKLTTDPTLTKLIQLQHAFTQLETRHYVLPHDADMLDRMRSYVRVRRHKISANFTIFIPQLAGLALPAAERSKCLEKINKAYERLSQSGQGIETNAKDCHIQGLNLHLK